MTDYLLIAAASVAAAFILFAGILAGRKQGWAPAAAALPACLVLGFVLAKAMYEVLMRADYFLQWGEWEVFLDLQPRRMCFTAGAAGVCLGVVLGAKFTGRKPSAVLDCFAAPGALLVAGLRMGEILLGKLGAGTLAEGTGLFAQPPFVIVDEYGDSYAAVFFWEALTAAAVCVYALASREKRVGLRFQKTAFILCVCQILLENMRNHSMKWGFVCVEQVICALFMLALMIAAVRRSGRPGLFPVARYFLCIAAVVGAEFARQKGGSVFLSTYGYWLMALVLAAMAWNYFALIRHIPE